MGQPLNVLIVDDSEDDAELILCELREGGFDPVSERVDTAEAMALALHNRAWDAIICDYNMPRFSALSALRLLKQSEQDLPFLILSGTVADAVGAAIMRDGAHDFLTKTDLSRLIPALDREMRQAAERKARRSESQERERLTAAFSLYLHPKLAGLAARNPARLRLGGEKRELTVLFADLRGFTSLSESMPPELLVEVLNDYLDAMTEVIFEHDGLLDKYIGDGIMALWGAPLPSDDHAFQACHAALRMVARLEELQSTWRSRGLPPVQMGVGINTGPMIVGNIGSQRRFTYTAVGDHVNLGSRLEELTKHYNLRILVSEYTYARVRPYFHVRQVDTVVVRGRRQPVTVYELLGAVEERLASARHEISEEAFQV